VVGRPSAPRAAVPPVRVRLVLPSLPPIRYRDGGLRVHADLGGSGASAGKNHPTVAGCVATSLSGRIGMLLVPRHAVGAR
jgi:hypothetical protein